MASLEDKGGYRTMTEIAKDMIKESILNNEFKPGMHLKPNLLSKELNLGLAAIREALRELIGSGLLTAVPNKGAMVAKPITAQEWEELFEIRCSLEGKAAMKAAIMISESEIVKLEQLNQKLEDFANNPKEYFILNKKFHEIFYRSTKWDLFCQMIGQIIDRIEVFRSIYPFHEQSIKIYIDQHVELLNAARDRNGEQAREIIIRHLKTGYESTLKRIELQKK